jgi:hemerythrin-like domain-containing protein
MKPRGALMIEHRLIEKMFSLVELEISKTETEGKANPVFIDTMVDFVRTYADRTHHGKEEDILFVRLAAKQMSAEDQQLMEELIEEHKFARKIVSELVEAKEAYVRGDEDCLKTIIDKMDALSKFYPEHILKEDKQFFPSTETYFTQEELDTMLSDFWEFDRSMIHEKYKTVVEQLKMR